MRVREAQFAATVPWDGILGKPATFDGPDGVITIDDVQGLRQALAGKQPAGGLARVATTGNYNDLNNKPALGSAAFVDVSNFITPAQLTAALAGYTTFAQSMARSFCKC